MPPVSRSDASEEVWVRASLGGCLDVESVLAGATTTIMKCSTQDNCCFSATTRSEATRPTGASLHLIDSASPRRQTGYKGKMLLDRMMNEPILSAFV